MDSSLTPDLELTFEGHIPSKKNSHRRIARATAGGGNRTFTIPSQAHEDWHRLEFLSLAGQIPGCRKIAEQCGVNPALLSQPQLFPPARLGTLVKAMRDYSAVFAGPYRLEYDFYPGTLAAFDLSNAEESINDLLVDLRVLEDDSWFHLRGRYGRVAGYLPGQEHCVVRLYCVPRGLAEDALSGLLAKDKLKTRAKQEGITQAALKRRLLTQLENGLIN